MPGRSSELRLGTPESESEFAFRANASDSDFENPRCGDTSGSDSNLTRHYARQSRRVNCFLKTYGPTTRYCVGVVALVAIVGTSVFLVASLIRPSQTAPGRITTLTVFSEEHCGTGCKDCSKATGCEKCDEGYERIQHTVEKASTPRRLHPGDEGYERIEHTDEKAAKKQSRWNCQKLHKDNSGKEPHTKEETKAKGEKHSDDDTVVEDTKKNEANISGKDDTNDKTDDRNDGSGREDTKKNGANISGKDDTNDKTDDRNDGSGLFPPTKDDTNDKTDERNDGFGLFPPTCLCVDDSGAKIGMAATEKTEPRCTNDQGNVCTECLPGYVLRGHHCERTLESQLAANVVAHAKAHGSRIQYGEDADFEQEVSFDCENRAMVWELVWSRRKKIWCCKHEKIGCVPELVPGDVCSRLMVDEDGCGLLGCCEWTSDGCHKSPNSGGNLCQPSFTFENNGRCLTFQEGFGTVIIRPCDEEKNMELWAPTDRTQIMDIFGQCITSSANFKLGEIVRLRPCLVLDVNSVQHFKFDPDTFAIKHGSFCLEADAASEKVTMEACLGGKESQQWKSSERISKNPVAQI